MLSRQEHVVLQHSTDGSPDEVRKMHRKQAGRLLRLIHDHQAEINDAGLALFRRCAFTFWLDGRDA